MSDLDVKQVKVNVKRVLGMNILYKTSRLA